MMLLQGGSGWEELPPNKFSIDIAYGEDFCERGPKLWMISFEKI